MHPVIKALRFMRPFAVCYLMLCLLLGVLQRSLIYFPSRAPESNLLAQARELHCEPWRDASGAIVGWKAARAGGPPAANRLIIFHGNAGYALHRTHYISG